MIDKLKEASNNKLWYTFINFVNTYIKLWYTYINFLKKVVLYI